MAKVHIVNHTHWDREWYFTTADALVLSDNCFTYVLAELSRNPRAKFCLDGQSSIVEDYLNIRSEKLEEFRQYVSQGRLAIGPWYTQTDAFFVDGESIIRNLILGIRDSKYYGGYMNIGYLPDSFGFNAQLPMIFRNCGIDSFIFFRGIHFGKQVNSPYFRWKSLGGKEVIAVNLVKGYGVAAFLEDNDTYVNNKLLPAAKRIKELSGLSEILVPIGEDQLDIVRDLPEKLDAISNRTEDDFIISSYPEFIDYLKNTDLEEYQGEFREPCLSRVHKSIGSIRYDIKRVNFLLEQKLTKRVEPLMAIGRANGIEVGEKILNRAWKKLLETHAHDSMGGCISDNVAVDILHRMKEADEIADGIENIIMKRLGEKTGLKENEILVFNTLPSAFDGYKVIQIVASSKNVKIEGYDNAMILDAQYYPERQNVRIVSSAGEKYITEASYYKLTMRVKMDMPPMGYKIIRFSESPEYTAVELEPSRDDSISNRYYTIGIQDGKLYVKTAFGKVIHNFIVFEDCGNDGDTYDFSPLPGDAAIELVLRNVEIQKAPAMEVLSLQGEFDLPLRLEDRLDNNGNKGKLAIHMDIALMKDTNRIDITCAVDNQIYSHRLRVKIKTGIAADKTIASVPFGYIRRDVSGSIPENWRENYVEMPIDIEPFESSVSVENGDYHITAFAKGIKEYQFAGDCLNLTLFSSTGQLGKENLLYRPGRASGDTTRQGHLMVETPMAELIGASEFEFAVNINNGAFQEYQAAKCWEEYTAEHPSYQTQSLNKFIFRLDNKIQQREAVGTAPRTFSLLSLPNHVLFGSIAPSLYEENSTILRLKNPTGEPLLLEDFDFSQFAKAEKVNYIEVPCGEQSFTIPPYDTLTMKLTYK